MRVLETVLKIVVASSLLLVGCGQEAPEARRSTLADTRVSSCIDGDGDGYGEGCPETDCDDADPTVASSCAKDPEPPACETGALRECKTETEDNFGVKTCWVGVERCEEGVWGPCLVEA